MLTILRGLVISGGLGSVCREYEDQRKLKALEHEFNKLSKGKKKEAKKAKGTSKKE